MLKPQQTPVLFKNNEVILTFRIYEVAPDEFAGILSPALASELTALMQETSENQPARILVNNGNIVSVIGSDIDVILSDPEGGEVDYNEIAQTPALMSADVQNCMEVIPHEPQSELISTYAAYPGTYDLNTTIRETQGSEKWCMAYSLAFILNYRKGVSSYKAKDIMHYFYPESSMPDSTLVNIGLTPTQAKDYALSQNITIVEHRNQMGSPIQVTEPALKSCISNGKPALLECQNLDNLNSLHAIVAKGYTSAVFIIWNPWYNYYETIPVSSMIYIDHNKKRFDIFGYIA